jgi:hypothetical protein
MVDSGSALDGLAAPTHPTGTIGVSWPTHGMVARSRLTRPPNLPSLGQMPLVNGRWWLAASGGAAWPDKHLLLHHVALCLPTWWACVSAAFVRDMSPPPAPMSRAACVATGKGTRPAHARGPITG